MSTHSEPEKDLQINRELEQMPHEPLLPVEKSLIFWSLVIGAVLMAILAWISYTFFSAT